MTTLETELQPSQLGQLEFAVNEPATTTRSFEQLGLSPKLLKRLEKIGYLRPSPIQAAFIPLALSGVDCTGQAQTGTGKTAAFSLPILQMYDPESFDTQALILVPTRELGEQVAEEIRNLAGRQTCHTVVLVGGRPIRKQLGQLKQGAQIVVGTPGRVIDMIQRRALVLDQIKFVVLDEADRMLDIGFRPDIEKILKRCPEQRQSMLLSATMHPSVERLAKRYMNDPQRVDLSNKNVAVDSIEQFFATVERHRKLGLLIHLLKDEQPRQVIVFTRTRRGASKLHDQFAHRLPGVAVIHGELPQFKRDRVMQNFRNGKIRMLIATDVVGRGIDISGISHIINYDIPEDCDDYVHRIGRTGRMTSAEKGRAFTFVAPDEGEQLTRIEMLVNQMLTEYKPAGFKAYKPRPPRPHVDQQDVFGLAKAPEETTETEEVDDFGSGLLE